MGLKRNSIEERGNYENYVFTLVVTAIIDGGARGVDSLASRYSVEHGIESVRVPAEWKLYHRGAGPVRNRKMAEMGDMLLALWDGESRGTMDMIMCANKQGIPVTVVYTITG